MKFISWNVNGIRACQRKGFEDFLASAGPDAICLQEVKAHAEQVNLNTDGYHVFWNAAKKPGYSGTAILTREKPLGAVCGIGAAEHGNEGRVLTLEYPDYHLVNVYTPNAQHGLTRLDYRMEWDAAFLAHMKKLEKKKPVVFCGDLNVAHREIDLANPKTNRKNPGFTDEERAGFDAIIEAGFIDTFREFEEGPGHYSWWSYRANARARNIGWRIDYFLISGELRPRLKSAGILPGVMGSDHCPVTVELD